MPSTAWLVEQTPSGIVINFALRDSGDSRDQRFFSWRWLRDHASDPASLDPANQQRLVDTFAIDPTVAGEANLENGTLSVSWPDSTTTVLIQDLANACGILRPTDDRQAWTAETAVVNKFAFHEVTSDDEALVAWLHQIHLLGFAVVSDVPAELAETQRLLERIGPVRNSIFGTMWTVESGSGAHADSSYTSEALEPHTDSTYNNDAPGLQLLHFTRQAETGGESTLVDGLNVYQQLQSASAEHAETLSRVPVTGRYIEDRVHLEATRPAIRLDRNGHLKQLSFNNYDRAPMWLPADEMAAFYNAYQALHGIIVDPANLLRIKIGSGEALIFDNWRLLHGRSAFTGQRCFQGGYLNHEDFESKRRVLALDR